jgi:hypothetical protein
MDALAEHWQDPRPNVVKEAASWLRHSFASQESLAAVRGALERCRAAGASKEDLSYLEHVIRDIQQEMAEKTKRPRK